MKGIRRSLKNDSANGGGASSSNHINTNAVGGAMHHAMSSNHHILGGGNNSQLNGIYASGAANSSNASLRSGSSAPANGISLAPRPGAAGKVPPKKVIRAVASYRAQSMRELSFEAGDFFHVAHDGYAQETAEGAWFDASNPLTGARGLVPAACFQVLGRNERENRATAPSSSSIQGNNVNGGMPVPTNNGLSPPASLPQSQQYGFPQSRNSGGKQSSISPTPSPSSANFPQTSANASSSSLPNPPRAGTPASTVKRKTQPLYGVVQYDFRAERKDELDAKRGESIIVIAQSNHEWFVAKPIGRLGGPGLIPVSFVAISHTTTGEHLPAEKVRDMIESGMVPPVDEWKKMTAEYKQASIPLGRFEFPTESTSRSNLTTPTASSSSSQGPAAWSNGAPGPEDVDLTPKASIPYPSASRQPGLNPNASGTNSSDQQRSVVQQKQAPSAAQQYQQQYVQQNGSYNGAHQHTEPDYAEGSPTQPMHPNGQGRDDETGLASGGNTSTEEDYYDKYGLVTTATVESFHSEEENYWFHLRVNFAQSGYSLILYRLYEDFFEFHHALMEEFLVEAGNALPPDAPPGSQPRRIIPKMPGPVNNVDHIVCATRVNDLTTYLKGLVLLPDYMRSHPLFYEFLMPRPGDVEVAVPNDAMRARWEAEKARDRERDREVAQSAAGMRQRALDEEVVEYLDQMGSVTSGMAKATVSKQNGVDTTQSGGQKKPTNLPPLNTSTSSSKGGGPFAGYTMASGGNSPVYQQQRPPSNTGPGSYMSPASYSSDNKGTQGNPLSAGSGISFISPFAQGSVQQPSAQHGQSSSVSSAHHRQAGGASQSNAANPPPFVKIKIFHRNTDDLIAIRVPPSIRLGPLLDKVRERLGSEVSHFRYRDETNQPLSPTQMQSLIVLSGGARLVELQSDEELDEWVQTAQRLVAYVD